MNDAMLTAIRDVLRERTPALPMANSFQLPGLHSKRDLEEKTQKFSESFKELQDEIVNSVPVPVVNVNTPAPIVNVKVDKLDLQPLVAAIEKVGQTMEQRAAAAQLVALEQIAKIGHSLEMFMGELAKAVLNQKPPTINVKMDAPSIPAPIINLPRIQRSVMTPKRDRDNEITESTTVHTYSDE